MVSVIFAEEDFNCMTFKRNVLKTQNQNFEDKNKV